MNDLRNKKFIDFPGFNVSVFGFPSFGESANAQFTIYPYYETFFLGPEKNYGDFEIDPQYPQLPSDIIKQKGTLIAFPSFINHRVTPVTSGTRKSLVSWIQGPKFR